MKRTIYIYNMFGHWHKLIIGSIILLIALIGCSKECPDAPKNYNKGILTFLNSSPYTIVIDKMVQIRDSQSRTGVLNQVVYRSRRFQLPNLFDGGVVFQGGDRIKLEYSSKAVDQTGTPIFSKTVILMVNGTAVIRIKGQDGSYEISGS